MNDPLTIPANPGRAVWLFAIELPGDLPDDALDAFLATDIGAALGVGQLDLEQVELVDTDTIRPIGLSNYLSNAHALDEAAVAQDAAMLDALEGHVLMVFRAALGPGPARFAPQPPLRFVGHYAEPAPPLPHPMPVPEAAKGVLTDPPQRKVPSDAAMGGRVAMAVLVFLFLFVLVFVWMAS